MSYLKEELGNWAAFFKYSSLLVLLFGVPVLLFLVIAGPLAYLANETTGVIGAAFVIFLVWYAVMRLFQHFFD